MAPSKSKLLLITLLLLTLIGIATVFLILRMTKLRDHSERNEDPTNETSFRIDSDSLSPPDNQNIYFVEASPSTSTQSSTLITPGFSEDLDHCRRISANLSKLKCSQK